MNDRLATMLAKDAVARREERLRSFSPAQVARTESSSRRPRRRSEPVPGVVPGGVRARKWAGHALERGGRLLVQTGARLARDHGSSIAVHS